MRLLNILFVVMMVLSALGFGEEYFFHGNQHPKHYFAVLCVMGAGVCFYIGARVRYNLSQAMDKSP